MTNRKKPAVGLLQTPDDPPRVAFLVPWRSDGAAREALWRVCRSRWEQLFPDWPIVEGTPDPGPFNRAQAINRAAEQAGEWDVAIVIDADVMVREEQVRAAVATALRTGRPTWAHRSWVGLTQAYTERVIEGDAPADPDAPELLEALAEAKRTGATDGVVVEKMTPLSWSCCLAIPFSAWKALGGFDERFRGWGWEDGAFAATIQCVTGFERIEGQVINLWHPRLPGSGQASRDAAGRYTVDAIRNARLGRRYMVAARRDHGLHDRDEGEVTDEVMARDVTNIMRDEVRMPKGVWTPTLDQLREGIGLPPGWTDPEAERLGMPDWAGWWPTIAELRSRLEPAGPMPAIGRVALVVHSGGTAETWPERSLYLREALDGYNARLRLPMPWERRVVFSDWPPEERAELVLIAEERGFYVVGPEDQQGFTRSMQLMWRYIDRNVGADFVFQAEDDFQLTRDVDVAEMARALASQPHLVQMALLRAPCYPPEYEKGTILGHPREHFEERTDGARQWLEHRRFFTLNPMLIRKDLTRREWPTGEHTETIYGRLLFSDRRARSAFWGDGSSWMTHLGETRAGSGY